MKLIEEFMKRIREENNSFVIEMPRRNDEVTTYHFMQNKVGNAVLVYGDYSYYDEDFYLRVNYQPEMCAIVTEDMVYIVNEFLLSLRSDDDYPDGARKYSDYVEEIKKDITNNVFLTYWNNIEVSKENNMEISEQIKTVVRNCIMHNDTMPRLDERMHVNRCPINGIDCIKELCGLIDVKKESVKYFDDKKELLTEIKMEYELIKRLISECAYVEDWEMEIVNGLNSVDAKTVNVTFYFNGKVGTEKIETDTLKRILRQKDYFAGSYFCNTTKGNNMIKMLGAGTYWSAPTEVLTCRHIEKITFGKKTLYHKNASK